MPKRNNQDPEAERDLEFLDDGRANVARPTQSTRCDGAGGPCELTGTPERAGDGTQLLQCTIVVPP
jgi:hypothetical protein